MTKPASKRKLVAILSADAAGYSRLMGTDEAATVDTLKRYRTLIGQLIERHGGRVVNAPGDSVLAEFSSAVSAVQAAVEIQKDLEVQNAELTPGRRMLFRIGVNLGDVIQEQDGSIYGDGVNIAARMESLAQPGGVCVSATVFDSVEGKLDAGFEFLGEQQVKNISKPVRVYRVRTGDAGTPTTSARYTRRVSLFVSAGALGVIALAGGLWLIRGHIAGQMAADPMSAAATAKLAAHEDPTLAVPKGPAIAVLPFATLASGAEEAHFSDGFTEELISQLSRFQDLRVIARQSTLKYRDRSEDVREIGRDLGVRFVVEGSVRRDKKRIRVRAQLIDTRDGSHLWVETYDRALAVENLLAVQDEIANRIVAAIADNYGIIMRNLAKESRIKPPEDMSVYECVHSYYEYSIVNTEPTHRRAVNCLGEAVKKYPDYAEAWGLLAELYAEDYGTGFDKIPNALDRALEAGEKGVKIDPDGQRAHWGLAYAHLIRKERGPFLEHAEKALSLNPNRPSLVSMIGWGLCLAGQWSKGEWKRGLALIEKGAQFNPHRPGWILFPVAMDRYLSADYERALDVARKIDMPDLFYDPMIRAAILAQMGRLDEANAALQDALKLRPDIPARGRSLWENYYFDKEVVDRLFDGLKKAGLESPRSGA